MKTPTQPSAGRSVRPREPSSPRPLDARSLIEGIRAGNRAALARAITLIESKRLDHQKAARALVQELLARTGTKIGANRALGLPRLGNDDCRARGPANVFRLPVRIPRGQSVFYCVWWSAG